MTAQMQFEPTLDRLRDRFLANHFARHDGLELLLDSMRRHNGPADCAARAEAVLHEIAGAAGSLGLSDLGRAAGLIETFIQDQLALQAPDFGLICDAMDAFLDISLQVCNPTDWPVADSVTVTPRRAAQASSSAA